VRSLREALPGTLAALGITRKTQEAQLLWLWPQVVGSLLAEETSALRVAQGVLWVQATSTPLAHQLHLERQGLVERLNAALGRPVLRDIRFRQGPKP